MNLGELQEELSRGLLRPAYLVTGDPKAGEEALLRDDALAAIRETALAGAPEDFNLDRLAGERTSVGDLQDAVRSLPVMAAHRLVMLREPEAGRGGERPLVAALPGVVDEVRAQEQVVLVVVAAKVNRGSRWVKAFKEPAAVVSCGPPKGAKAITEFALGEARRQGIDLEPRAAALLAERLGPQLLMLRQEIAKAALLAGPGEKVRRGHVEVSTGRVAEEPFWNLTDAIGEGGTARAVCQLARMLRAGAAPSPILGALAAHFRKLVRLRGGESISGPPFVVRKLGRQAGRYTEARLLVCLSAIHAADTALKGAGSLPPELVLERLVIGLSG